MPIHVTFLSTLQLDHDEKRQSHRSQRNEPDTKTSGGPDHRDKHVACASLDCSCFRRAWKG